MDTDRCGGSRDESVSRGWRRWSRIVPVVGLAMVVGEPATAQSPGLYDTSRTLEHLGNECLGVPNCLTVESPPTTIAVGKHTSLTVRCPSSHPHVIGWDTEQSEHLAAYLPPARVGGAFGERPRGRGAPAPTLTLLVANHAHEPGVIKLFLGCAEVEPRVTAVRQHRGAVPSNHGAGAQGRP